MTPPTWVEDVKRMTYQCHPQCGFWTFREEVYLRHLAECERVAHWVSGWAKRMVARNEACPHG